jgi:hypothetical protein
MNTANVRLRLDKFARREESHTVDDRRFAISKWQGRDERAR